MFRGLEQHMASKSLTPHPTLAIVAPGPATALRSSSNLNWNGIIVERHVCDPGERPAELVDRPVLAMLCSAVSHGEHRAVTGEFLPYRKTFGAFTTIPTGLIPQLRLLQKSEMAYFAVDNAYLSRIIEEMEGPVSPITFQSGKRDPKLLSLFGLLLAELESPEVGEPLYVDTVAHAATIRFLKLGTHASASEDPKWVRSSAARLSRVKERIDASLKERLTLNLLAAEMGFSRAHFLRWFRASTGMTPHEYLLEQRLERARILLASRKLALIDISAECGFSSQSHMTNAFRNRFGVTPSLYRQRSADRL